MKLYFIQKLNPGLDDLYKLISLDVDYQIFEMTNIYFCQPLCTLYLHMIHKLSFI